MNVLRWFDNNFERVALKILLAIISSLLMFQIVMRYCFSSALPWAEELARYGFVVSAYLCIGFCIKEGLLFRIDSIFNLLPAKLRKILDVTMWGVSLVFFVYCTVQSVKVAIIAAESRMLSPALEMPVVYLYIAATLGFLLAVLRSIQHLIKIKRCEIKYEEKLKSKRVKKGA